MAADYRFCVSALEGAFVSLREVSILLPDCMHLQDKGARLESDQWPAKGRCRVLFSLFSLLAGSRGGCGKVPKAPKVEKAQEEVCKD